jgi:tetratricopeptide (TPR) repeat protein
VRLIASVLVLRSVVPAAAPNDYERAKSLYEKTEYAVAADLLTHSSQPKSPAAWALLGQCYYQDGEYKKAIEAFEKASLNEPSNSFYHNWLGRAWGRRAETSNPLMAPVYAGRARQYFEEAVKLDPKNLEAVDDLFSYYLEAPGFLGGGVDKAAALAETIKTNDPAEYHYALAQVAIRRKQFDVAERFLSLAADLAPKQVGRLIDLAKFLAGRGKYQDSEAMFAKAQAVAPQDTRVLYARAEVYVESRRNLDIAKKLLNEYLQGPITPDHPSREEARRLLKRISGE